MLFRSLGAEQWRDAMAIHLALCPPSLMGVTDPDDPLGRKALTAKLGGGVVKKHNELVRSVSSLEREAGRISIMEVAGLYPDDRRVDTLSVAGDGHVDMTDCRVVDPHTAARMAAGESVRGAMIKAENEKNRKYNFAGDCKLRGVLLLPLVFTPGGRIGPSLERYLRQLAADKVKHCYPQLRSVQLQQHFVLVMFVLLDYQLLLLMFLV